MNQRLSIRDHQVIASVRLLGQLTTPQIQRLHFSEPGTSVVSRPVRTRRALRRLVKWGELARIENRGVGAHIGGSDSFTYTPAGKKARRRDDHTIDIAEFYVRLLEFERTGGLEVLEFSPEDQFMEGIKSKADAYLWCKVNGRKSDYLIEIDRGSETKTQIKAKLKAYTKAAGRADYFPHVVFVVTFNPTGSLEDRANMIGALCDLEEYPEMFKVCVMEKAWSLFK